MASDDDDGDDVFGRKVHALCDCAIRHPPSYRCAGCGICYFKALEIYNSGLDKAQPAELEEASKNFGGLTFGSVYWFCSDCKSMFTEHGCVLNFFRKSLDEIKRPVIAVANDDKQLDVMEEEDSSATESNTLLLNKLSTESKEMKAKLDDVLDYLQQFSSNVPASPVRKCARVSFLDGDDNPSLQLFDASSTKHQSSLTNDTRKENNAISYSDKVKMNIKIGETSTSSDVLKRLYDAKSTMPSFTGRKKSNGSIDILFKSFEDANQAKTVLDEKLNDAVVDRPTPAKLTRFNLVGLPFNMSVSETMSSLIDENKNWLDLEKSSDNSVSMRNDPLSSIHVHSITKCKNNDIFMAAVSMSANMVATLGFRKLSIGFVKCKLYKWKLHHRCYKCQQTGHYAASCKNSVACSKCSGEHDLKECDSALEKCVNCTLHARDDTNHASYSSSCPYNN